MFDSEIIIILVLILANGVFSMSEISIISARRIRLQKMAEQGSHGAKVALKLAAEPNKFLSTVQFGITLISVITGVFGGQGIANKIKPWLETFDNIQPYADSVSLGIVVVIITFLSLIIGELVPKRIGLSNPEKIAATMAPMMQLISKAGSPFVWVLSHTSELIMKILGMNHVNDQTVTEEEIKAMIEEGTQGGHFEVTEQKMVEQVFRMADKRVEELMTPRMDIVFIDVNAPLEENFATLKENPHTYLPVCEDSLDDVLGIIQIKDLAVYQFEKNIDNFSLKALIKPALFVPENMKAFLLLETMREEKMYFALVIDEFGTLQGAVTMNDVLQEIAIAHLEAEENEPDNYIFRREDGSYLVDGLTPKDYFKDYFGIKKTLPHEDDYNTIAGLIIYGLSYIPEIGESYTWERFKFEIMDKDSNRIDKILVTEL
jgi:putative hemolysin